MIKFGMIGAYISSLRLYYESHKVLMWEQQQILPMALPGTLYHQEYLKIIKHPKVTQK